MKPLFITQELIDDAGGDMYVPDSMASIIWEEIHLQMTNPEEYARRRKARAEKYEREQAERQRIRNLWHNRLRVWIAGHILRFAYWVGAEQELADDWESD